RWPRPAARHDHRRAADRPFRRHHLDALFLADAGKNAGDADGGDGAGVPPAGPVRDGGEMTMPRSTRKDIFLHLAVIAVLLAANYVLPEYHRSVLSRVLVLAVFAMGYNLLFGYTGLRSLGHAMFFAAGMYGAGLPIYHLGWNVPVSFASGIVSGALLALVIGLLALRTTGVAFMIVTMMFAQIFFLATLFITTWTRGEEGLVRTPAMRTLDLGGTAISLSEPSLRYRIGWALFSIVLLLSLWLVRSPFGRTLVAIRENEE